MHWLRDLTGLTYNPRLPAGGSSSLYYNCPEPQFPHQYNGDNNRTHLTELLREVYLFLIAAVTNCPELSGLKPHKCILLLEIRNQNMDLKLRCWQGCVLSGSSGGQSVLLPFPASRGCLHSLAGNPFLHLQSDQSRIFHTLCL